MKSGADFIITQVGYDARKFDEILRFMRQQGIQVPLIGNVYILNRPVARVMNRGEVPGCVVTDDLYRIIEEESKAPDKGKAARLTRAAKLIAVLKGIGYQGVHIGGPNLKYEDVEWVIEKAKEFSANWEDWVREFSFPQEDGFYLFTEDSKTGLNTDVPNFRRSHPAQKMGLPHDALSSTILSLLPAPPSISPPAGSSGKIDGTRLGNSLYRAGILDQVCFLPLPALRGLHAARGCFSLSPVPVREISALTASAGAPGGWCEVFPGKKRCIYVRAYDRLKAYREEESLKEGYIPPRELGLGRDFFLGQLFPRPGPPGVESKGGWPESRQGLSAQLIQKK